MRGLKIQIPLLKADHRQPASETPFIWHFAGGPIWWRKIGCWLGSFEIFQWNHTNTAKTPYKFVIFQGGPDPQPPTHSGIRAWTRKFLNLHCYTCSKHILLIEDLYLFLCKHFSLCRLNAFTHGLEWFPLAFKDPPGITECIISLDTMLEF